MHLPKEWGIDPSKDDTFYLHKDKARAERNTSFTPETAKTRLKSRLPKAQPTPGKN